MNRILIVDDESLLAETLQSFLKSEGFQADVANNGETALRMVKEEDYDLMIVDIFMPEKDGIATIMDLKKINDRCKVIAMSGGGNVIKNFDYLEYAQALGAIRCFQKPIDPSELLACVKAAL